MVDYNLIEEYYNQGLSDNKISEKVGCSKRSVTVWRQRENKSPNNLKKERKFTDEKLVELHSLGFVDKEIANMLNCSDTTVNFHRNKLGLRSNQQKSIEITREQDEILIGTILDDNWNIKSNIHKDGTTYIISKHKNDFITLIQPYIIPSMKYKTQSL